MQYEDSYDDPYGGQDEAEEGEAPREKGAEPRSVISIFMSDQRLLAKAVGALVCFMIALLLAVSTGFMVLRQSRVRAAVRDYYGSSQTQSALKKPSSKSLQYYFALARDHPENLAMQLLYAEKLRANGNDEEARAAFENAIATPDHIGEGYLGQAAVFLDMAVAKPDHQKTRIQAARDALDNIDQEALSFDKSVMQAAASLVEGNASQAVSLLEALKSELDEEQLVPNRAALEAFEYHLGIAQLLTGSQECLTSLRRAGQRRGRWPEIGRVLKNACLIVMQQSDQLDKNQKLIEQIKPILKAFIRPGRRSEPVSFYALTVEDCSEIYNAFGLSMYRLKQYLLAATYFEEALKKTKAAQELLYRINMACALRKAGLKTEVGRRERNERLKKSAEQFRAVYSRIRNDAERKPLANLILKQLIELQFQVRKFSELRKLLKTYRENGNNAAEAYRLEGIMFEMTKRTRQAKRSYLRAIDANHPDSGDLEVRIEALGG